MPGATVHHSYDRHVRIAAETAFGVVHADPSWSDVPFPAGGFGLKATSPRFMPPTNVAGYRRRVGVHHQQVVEGSFNTLAWPDHLFALLTMGLTRDGNGDLSSYTIDHFTPVDPRRYLGAVAENLTLRVGGDGELAVELGLRAKVEEEANTLIAGDFDYSSMNLIPFMLRDARLEINSEHVTDVEEFSISVANNVAQGPMVRTSGITQGTVAYLAAGRREITLDLTKLSDSDRFEEAIRDGNELTFEAVFEHPSGHRLELQLPLLVVEGSDESDSDTEPVKANPKMVALSNSDDDDIIWAVDLGPTTTTLAPLTTTAAPTTTTAAPTTTTTEA